MKNTIFIIIFSGLAMICHAQTDSIYREVFAKKVNEFRKGKFIKPVNLSRSLNLATEAVLKKGSSFKDSRGNYNNDSIRKVLRANHIYDYKFEILEKSAKVKNGLIIDNSLSADLQNALKDTLHNSIGISTGINNEIVILTAHYIDIDNLVRVEVKMKDFDHPEKLIKTAIIQGITDLDKITICPFTKTANVETDTPLYKKQLIKKGKAFKIELDISEANTAPSKVTFVDEKGNVISQFNLSNK